MYHIECVLPPIPWHPRICYVGTAVPVLDENLQYSAPSVEIVSIAIFVRRYGIALLIDSHPISNTTTVEIANRTTRKKAPPLRYLDTTPAHMNTPGDTLFGPIFDCHYTTRRYVEYHIPTEVRPKAASNSKIITPPGGKPFTQNTSTTTTPAVP